MLYEFLATCALSIFFACGIRSTKIQVSNVWLLLNSGICVVETGLFNYRFFPRLFMFFISWYAMHTLAHGKIPPWYKLLSLQFGTWTLWAFILNDANPVYCEMMLYGMFVVLSLVYYNFMPENVKNQFLLIYALAFMSLLIHALFLRHVVVMSFLYVSTRLVFVEAIDLWIWFSAMEKHNMKENKIQQ